MADKPDAAEVREQLRVLAEDISKLTQLVRDLALNTAGEAREGLAGKLDDLAGASQDMAGKAQAKVKGEIAALEEQIAERPVQSALIAFLLGLALGTFTRR